MKKQLLIIAAAAGFFYLSLSSFQLAPTFKAQNLNCTQGPGSGGTCASAGTGCHDAVTHTAGTTKITVRKKSAGLNSAPVTEYQNDSSYYVTISVMHPSLNAFGLQAEVLNDSDKNYGVVSASGHLTGDTIGGLFVISSNKIPGTDSATFEWTAPSADTSNVTIYGAGVMANDDGAPMSDSLFKLTDMVLTWKDTPAHVAGVTRQISVTAYPNPVTGSMLTVSMRDITTGDYALSVYNALGQKIYAEAFTGRQVKVSVNTGNWPAGTYLLHVLGSDGATGVTPVIKQ